MELFKTKIYSSWNLSSNFFYKKQIEIYVDCFPYNNRGNDVIVIIMIQEPHFKSNAINFLKNYDLYDYVFTYFDDILKTNDKAIKFLCINTWIKNYSFKEKEFSISALVGGKDFLTGHRLRHELWNNSNKILTKKRFYLSSQTKYNLADYENNMVLGKTKDKLFDSMFHIVIENESINNMFTEKLIDCFQTKTVPIFWGCPNIGEYFDLNGIIVFDNIENLIKIANSLTEFDYFSRINSIMNNFELSKNYTDHSVMLDKKLNEIL